MTYLPTYTYLHLPAANCGGLGELGGSGMKDRGGDVGRDRFGLVLVLLFRIVDSSRGLKAD